MVKSIRFSRSKMEVVVLLMDTIVGEPQNVSGKVAARIRGNEPTPVRHAFNTGNTGFETQSCGPPRVLSNFILILTHNLIKTKKTLNAIKCGTAPLAVGWGRRLAPASTRPSTPCAPRSARPPQGVGKLSQGGCEVNPKGS